MRDNGESGVLLSVLHELHELEQRLADGATTLSEMADNTVNPTDRMRLYGKAQGLDLALSFVQEAIRAVG